MGRVQPKGNQHLDATKWHFRICPLGSGQLDLRPWTILVSYLFFTETTVYSSSAVDVMTDNPDYCSWVGELDEIFKDSGLVEICRESRHEPTPINKIASELLCMVCDELASIQPTQDARDKLHWYAEAAHVDIQNGHTVSKRLQVVTGRKPMLPHDGSAHDHLSECEKEPEEQDASAWYTPRPSLKRRRSPGGDAVFVHDIPTPAPSVDGQDGSASDTPA